MISDATKILWFVTWDRNGHYKSVLLHVWHYRLAQHNVHTIPWHTWFADSEAWSQNPIDICQKKKGKHMAKKHSLVINMCLLYSPHMLQSLKPRNPNTKENASHHWPARWPKQIPRRAATALCFYRIITTRGADTALCIYRRIMTRRASTGHAVSGECYRRNGKGRQHNPRRKWNKWMVSVDFLGTGLSQFGG